MTDDDRDPGLLARRLDELFRTTTTTDGKRHTNAGVARAINAAAGKHLISANYLSYLRSGQRTNPSHERLVAIAKYFGIDGTVTYFTDEDVPAGLALTTDLITAVLHPTIRAIATNAVGLPDDDLAAILSLVQNTRKLRDLPEVNPAEPDN